MKLPFGTGPARGLTSQFVLFSGVGVIAAVAHYGTLICLVELVALRAVAASALGFTAGALVNYSLNYRITFRSDKAHREAMAKFFTVALVGLGLNTAIMALATEVLALHYLLSQVLATGMVLVWNFTGNRLWTFREEGHAE